MSSPSTKFTDNNLKLFYGNLLNHYNDCINRPHRMDIDAIYHEMYLAVQFAVESTQGSLNHLDSEEKSKVYSSFNAIFYALPIYRELPTAQQQAFNPPRPVYDSQIRYVTNNYNNYNCNDSLLFNWLLLSSITDNCHHRVHLTPSHHHAHGGSYLPSSNQHAHSGSSAADDCVKFLFVLLLIALAFIAVILTFIALYYMLSQVADGFERLWYNEGWLKAALAMASAAAFGSASTLLTFTFGATPLIALAVLAGINPVGVLIAGATFLTIIGAGIGAFTMNLLSSSIERSLNKDAMDPNDPYRFRLTSGEEESLLRKGIDPIKVKCAMVALRAEIAKRLGNEEAIPSYFSRQRSDESDVQELLQKVRDLRSGAIYTAEVGDLSFDCQKINHHVYSQPQYGQQTFFGSAGSLPATGYYDTLPSAPPAYDAH